MVITREGFCTLPGSDRNGEIIPNGGTGIVQVTVVNGNITVKVCKGMATNESETAQTFVGFTCLIELPGGPVATTDTRVTIAADGTGDEEGQALATCFYPTRPGNAD
jgi:hypothetical protein